MHKADSVWKLSTSLTSADKPTEKALVAADCNGLVINSKPTMQYVNTDRLTVLRSGALSVA